MLLSQGEGNLRAVSHRRTKFRHQLLAPINELQQGRQVGCKKTWTRSKNSNSVIMKWLKVLEPVKIAILFRPISNLNLQLPGRTPSSTSTLNSILESLILRITSQVRNNSSAINSSSMVGVTLLVIAIWQRSSSSKVIKLTSLHHIPTCLWKLQETLLMIEQEHKLNSKMILKISSVPIDSYLVAMSYRAKQ